MAWQTANKNTGMIFYAEKLDSINTTDNVYWLTKGNGLKMTAVDGGSPAANLSVGSFTNTRHFEQDNIAVLVQVTPELLVLGLADE